jgi:hypothetical protein
MYYICAVIITVKIMKKAQSNDLEHKPILRVSSVDGMLFLINSIRQTDQYISDIYLNGGCYQFHLMLKKFAPNCEARITKEKNHIVTFFKGKHFDINGIVEGQFKPLNHKEIERASKWSFAKNKALKIRECPACEEPIVV